MDIQTKSTVIWEHEMLFNIIGYADYCERCVHETEMPLTYELWKKYAGYEEL